MWSRICNPVVLVVMFSIAVPARAAEPSARDRARATALVREGARLLEQKEWTQALARFESAYRLFPSPKIHFNVGLAEDGRGRPAAAWQAFRRYLDEAKDDTAERRAEAEARATGLLSRVLRVDLEADVDGSRVSVDGEDVGVTPLPNPIVLEPGAHAVVVRPPTGGTWTETVRGEAGATVRVQARLRALEPAAVAAAPAPVLPAPAEAPSVGLRVTETPAEPRPVYKRGWFWAGAGAVVLGAVAGAIVLSRGGGTAGAPVCDECDIPPIKVSLR